MPRQNIYMKIPALRVCALFCLFALSSATPSKKDCDDVKDYADSSYTYLKKAYRAETLEDAQSYAKKGMNAASSAEDEADDSDCACSNAEQASAQTYIYARKAYRAFTLEEAQNYAKKAMRAAEEITSEAEDCEDE